MYYYRKAIHIGSEFILVNLKTKKENVITLNNLIPSMNLSSKARDPGGILL